MAVVAAMSVAKVAAALVAVNVKSASGAAAAVVALRLVQRRL